jgi:hypothetical protein
VDCLIWNPNKLFSEDTSTLDKINQLATKPINFSNPIDMELVPKLDPAMLVTLYPINRWDLCGGVCISSHCHGLQPLCTAKITCLSSTLQVIAPLKDNPQAKACMTTITHHLQVFQKEGTATVKTSVLLEREYYQDQATPQFLHNVYHLCQSLITSQSM